ncbi:MAG TPA: hypothetical protein DEQ40_00620 [Oxalobacteraceae bacterium]|nr:hypothetical protein [Oxalobacteraceae bacterium]
MANSITFFGSPFGLAHAPAPSLFRLGRREIFVCKDFRKRFYSANRFVDCSAGVEPGHLEILLFRRWLVVLSMAR